MSSHLDESRVYRAIAQTKIWRNKKNKLANYHKKNPVPVLLRGGSHEGRRVLGGNGSYSGVTIEFSAPGDKSSEVSPRFLLGLRDSKASQNATQYKN